MLLYLKKSGLDKSGKAPIMGRITLGRNVAQFSCKLSCNPELWNPRESRVDGKSREAVEINGRLESLLLSVQSAYQALLSKGCPFDATDVKELFKAAYRHDVCLSNDWTSSSGRRKNILELTLREKQFRITILPVIILGHLSKTSTRWEICLSRNLQKISFMISGTTT